MLARIFHVLYYWALLPLSVVSGCAVVTTSAATLIAWAQCSNERQGGWVCSAAKFLDDYYSLATEVFLLALAILVIAWACSRLRRYWRMRTAIRNSFFTAKAFDALREADQEVSKILDRQRTSRERLNQTVENCYVRTQEVLNEISRFYGAYTGRPCHVSLKTFGIREGTASTLTTFVRDSEHRPYERKQIDEELEGFAYGDNTAFAQIIDTPKEFFVSNHLRLCALLGRYKNRNPHWTDYYSATLVVPLTDQINGEKISLATAIGFLCVDNQGGGFDRGIAVFSGRLFARLLYPVIVDFRALEFHASQENG